MAGLPPQQLGAVVRREVLDESGALESGERARASGAETARLRASPRGVSDPPAAAE